ncbi:hypothetical protein M9Y10_001773 [Tritrichomonas musculus]|uniref:HNH nuclease domain-containing protein n=1 Tax=Tritrichomonas musculus TaxID=1915356 RepID=A0ABR2IMG0_9EUKA
MSQPVEQANNEPVVEFVPLLNFEDDYEILNQYPFTIRKKSNHKVLKESINKEHGYIDVSLNQKIYRKHRLIALQFLPNDDPINNDVIDHINHDRTDNHLNNMRWCSQSANQYNKSYYKGVQYEFIDDIPNDSMMIDFYETKTARREFEANKYYYYHDETNNEDIFYGRITDNVYKVLHHNIAYSGNEYVNLRDINNKVVGLMINKFKHQHDLL